MNFLSTGRVNEKLDRRIWEVDEGWGVGGGTLKEKHPTSDFWDSPWICIFTRFSKHNQTPQDCGSLIFRQPFYRLAQESNPSRRVLSPLIEPSVDMFL